MQKEGIKVNPGVMIPLVGFTKELIQQIAVVRDVAEEVMKEKKVQAQLHGGHDD